MFVHISLPFLTLLTMIVRIALNLALLKQVNSETDMVAEVTNWKRRYLSHWLTYFKKGSWKPDEKYWDESFFTEPSEQSKEYKNNFQKNNSYKKNRYFSHVFLILLY